MVAGSISAVKILNMVHQFNYNTPNNKINSYIYQKKTNYTKIFIFDTSKTQESNKRRIRPMHNLKVELNRSHQKVDFLQRRKRTQTHTRGPISSQIYDINSCESRIWIFSMNKDRRLTLAIREPAHVFFSHTLLSTLSFSLHARASRSRNGQKTDTQHSGPHIILSIEQKIRHGCAKIEVSCSSVSRKWSYVRISHGQYTILHIVMLWTSV